VNFFQARRRFSAVASVVLLTLLSSSQSVQTNLTSATVLEAIQAGRAMYGPRNGYLWGPYLLREYNSGVRITSTSSLVDAVAVGTAFERIRYNSYLERFEGSALSTAEAMQIAQQNKNRLSVMLFTHSPYSVEAELEAWQQTYVAREDGRKVQRTYLDDFKPATLTVGGRTFTSKVQVEGPFQDAFSTEDKPEFRYLGVIHHQFDLTPLARSGSITGVGELRFKDTSGRNYTERIDLSRYR
jgi:hypothetical protein